MVRLRRKVESSAGQTMVEFMISVLVIMFFLFLMLSLAILMVTSEYLEYAAFMAARTYRTGYSTPDSQRNRAQKVAQQYIDNVTNLLSGGSAQIDVLDFNAGEVPNLNGVGAMGGGLAGVRIRYSMPLFYLPPVFVGAPIEPNIDLVTESYYGRDPSFSEACDPDNGQSFFRRFLSQFSLPGDVVGKVANQMEDNGC